jgi:hypothetical protein
LDWTAIDNKPLTYPPDSHTHDDRYYTEGEVDTKLSAKADSTTLSGHTGNTTVHVTQLNKDTWDAKAEGTHNHTKAEITDFAHNHDTDYADINHNHSGTYEPADSTILKDADIGVTVQGYNANTVVDSSYVHTDNNYTTAEKNKLASINISSGTADPTGGSSGDIYLQYE